MRRLGGEELGLGGVILGGAWLCSDMQHCGGYMFLPFLFVLYISYVLLDTRRELWQCLRGWVGEWVGGWVDSRMGGYVNGDFVCSVDAWFVLALWCSLHKGNI